MNRKVIIQLVVFASLLIVGFAITKTLIASKKELPIVQTEESLKKVKVSRVEYQPLQFDLQYQGRVVSSEIINLSSEVSGKIKPGQISFKTGQEFNRGMVLLTIEDNSVSAALKSMKSGLITQLSQILPDMKIDFNGSYNKWQAFFNAIEMDKPLPELPKFESEKEKIFIASKSIISTYYNIVQQEIALGKHTIKAPFDGYIYSADAEVGSIAGMGTRLGKIIRSDKLEIEVPVKRDDAKWLREGMACKVYSKAEDELNAKISRISGFVNRNTQMISVFVSVENRNMKMYEGEYLDLKIPVNKGQKVFKLFREAVVDGESIYMVKDNRLVKVEAEIVQQQPDTVYLTGVNAGALVVNESVIKPKIGEKVEIIN